jgi:hypothetical protein
MGVEDRWVVRVCDGWDRHTKSSCFFERGMGAWRVWWRRYCTRNTEVLFLARSPSIK